MFGLVPPSTVTSARSNPVTASLNVNVASIVSLAALNAAGSSVIVTVGAAASYTAVSLTAPAGPVLPATSVTRFAATSTFTSPLPSGVTSAV